MTNDATRRLSASEVRKSLLARRSKQDVDPWVEVAAPWIRFDPHALRMPGSTSNEHTSDKHSLFEHSRVVGHPIETGSPSGSEGSAWTLVPKARTAALSRLLRERRLSDQIAANTHESLRPENALFLRLLRGDPPEPGEVDSTLLPLWHDMEALLDDVEPRPKRRVDPSRLTQRVAHQALVAPLRRLTEGFVGRARELRTLRSYVDVAESQGLVESITRGVRRHIQVKRPVMVLHGRGGIGKSTLVAQFLLEHIDAPTRTPLLFALLDMEQPHLDEGRPTALVQEIASQISTFHPEHARQLERLRVSAPRRDSSVIAALADALDDISTTAPNVTILLVLDTFEVFQRKGNLVGRLRFMLEEIQEAIPQLRVLISGRAPAPDLIIDGREPIHHEVLGLETTHAVERLVQANISTTQASTIVKRIGTSPLSLTLAKLLLAENPDADLELGFWHRLDDARIQSELYVRHLGRVKDRRVAKVIHPGMTVRRLDECVLLEVLDEPCGLALKDASDASRLLSAMVDAAEYVERGSDGSIRYRSDLRAATLPLLAKSEPKLVEEIHRRAARFYASRNDAGARVEEIYHRLALGEVEAASNLWTSDIDLRIDDSELESFPFRTQQLVRARLGMSGDFEDLVTRLEEEGDFEALVELYDRNPVVRDIAPGGLAQGLQLLGRVEEGRGLARRARGTARGTTRSALDRVLETGRSPALYRGSKSSRNALVEFLLSAFSQQELVGFIRYAPSGSELLTVLPSIGMQSDAHIVDELATVINDAGLARMVVMRAGFPSESTPAFRSPIVFWNNVVDQLHSGRTLGGMRQLIETVARLYPGNAAFRAYLDADSSDSSRVASITEYVFAYVHEIEARDLIDDGFFERLLEHRPARRADIRELQALWRTQ